MHRETVAVLKPCAEVRKHLEDLGLDPVPSDPAKFQRLIKSDYAKWGKVIREAGIKEQ